MRCPLLLSLLAIPLCSNAQVGTNSSCANAIELEVASGNVQSSFVTVEGRWFTPAVPSPVTACSGSSNQMHSAWYSFTATTTKHWIRTEGMDMDDASMEVFSGGCGSLTSVQCFPSGGPTPVLSGLTVGATYHLRVLMTECGGFNSSNCQVYIAVVSAPVHDECEGAIELPVVSGMVQAWPSREISSLGATQSAPACTGNAAAANDDVWYRFTATAGTHFLPNKRMTGAVQDNVFQWYSGTCGNLTSIACDADFVSGLTPGTPYFIRAYNESTDPNITLRALVDVMAPAPNDECTGALAMTVATTGEAPVPVNFTTINTTSSTVPCETTPHDAWLTFTAPAPSVVVVVGAGGTGTLFSGSCGSLSCVSSGSGTTSGVTFTGLTPGATYFLKIGAGPVVRRNDKVWAFVPATNDACATGIEVDVQGDPMTFTHGHMFSSQTAWYRFVATAPSHVIEGYTTAGGWITGWNVALRTRVYSGDCGAGTQMASSSDLSVPLRLNGLVVGQTYHVEMWATSRMAFRFVLRGDVVNDDCEGAIELPFSSVEDQSSIAPAGPAQDGVGGCLPDHDLWYRFTAAHTSVTFLAQGATLSLTAALDAAIELYEGTCGSLTPIACVQDRTKATFTGLVPGNTYFIRWSRLHTNGFRPMLFDQPVNDDPAGALPAPIGSTFAQGGQQYWNFGASQTMTNPVPCAVGVPEDDMWYTFTATATTQGVVARQSNFSFTEAPITNGFRVIVYDTVTTDLDVLQEHVLTCGNSPLTLSGLMVGKQYLYRAYHTDWDANCGYITSVMGSNNDEPAGAQRLAYSDGYSVEFNTTGATQSMPGAACQVDDNADDDIWFKFTAASGPARLVIGQADRNLTIELFSGTPDNLTSIACDGNILDLPPLTVGQTYHARLYSWLHGTPVKGRIGLIATPSLTANGCVDEDCLGPVLVPNPGIEQGEHCLIHTAEISATEGLGTLLAPGWPRMQLGSADAWSSCASYDQRNENPGTRGAYTEVISRGGKGMGGVFMAEGDGAFKYVEYLQAPLSEPLVPGEPYLISFHAATDPYALCLSGLGAKLSAGPLAWTTYFEPIPVAPDVVSTEAICTAEWTNICAIVVPNTAVDHITIGAFQMHGEAVKIGNPNGSSYYFIDDVVVAHIDDASCITSIGDVPPLDEGANRGGDDLRVYPNPANDRVNIVGDAGLFGERAVIEVFDITGKRMHAEEVAWMQALQPLDLPADWKEGLYLVMVRVDGKAPRSARVVLRR